MAVSTEHLSVALPALVGVTLIALAILVIRFGAMHRHNLFFATYFVLSGLKSFSEGVDAKANGFHETSPLFPVELFWQLQAAFCSLVMLPMLLLFVGSFPRPLPRLVQHPALGAVVFVPSILVGGALVAYLLGHLGLEPFESIERAFNLYGTLISVFAAVYILQTTRRAKDPIERTQARFVIAGLLPAFAMGWVITGLQIAPDYGLMDAATAYRDITNLVHFVSPILELLAAALVGFAILKYNILGVSPNFRLGVRSFLVGGAFVAMFLFTQFIENVVLQGQLFGFAGDYGSFILSGITGIVLFKPMDRVANRLVPKEEDGSLSRAAEVYHAQCTYVLRDAQVTEREMTFLRNLREQLGLSEAQARAIEEEVERTLKVDAPQTGASASTAPAFIAKAAAELVQAPEVHRASPLPPAPQAPDVPAAASPPAAAPTPARPGQAGSKPKAAPAARKPATKPATKQAGKPAKAAAKDGKSAGKTAADKGKAPAKPGTKGPPKGRAGQSR